MAAETERPPASERPRPRRAGAAPDRLTVVLLTIAGFFAVLALLATQVHRAPIPKARPIVITRRVYETRVVETVPADVPASTGATVTQSVASAPATAMPVTRTSGG